MRERESESSGWGRKLRPDQTPSLFSWRLDFILQRAESRGEVLNMGKTRPDLHFGKSTERRGDWRGGRLVKTG